MKSRTPVLALLCMVGAGFAHGRDCYVSSTGNDANPGAQARPWRTVAKVNSVDSEARDCVYFQGGQRFPGTITLDRSAPGATTSGV